jgi:hypothetical protein
VGAEGEAWFNYPVQGIGTVVRISATGTIELIAESIGDVAGMMVSNAENLLATQDGLLRYEDDGTWASINEVGLNCIVERDGNWFGCLDALADIGAVGQWSGDSWQTSLQLGNVAGPMECPAPTDGSEDVCDEEWDAVQAAFLLGIASPQPQPQEPEVEPEVKSPPSCSVGSGSSSSWWLGLLIWGRLRRTGGTARPL